MKELSYTENASNTKPVLLLQAQKIMLICVGVEKQRKSVVCKNHRVKHSILISSKISGNSQKMGTKLKKKKRQILHNFWLIFKYLVGRMFQCLEIKQSDLTVSTRSEPYHSYAAKMRWWWGKLLTVAYQVSPKMLKNPTETSNCHLE